MSFFSSAGFGFSRRTRASAVEPRNPLLVLAGPALLLSRAIATRSRNASFSSRKRSSSAASSADDDAPNDVRRVTSACSRTVSACTRTGWRGGQWVGALTSCVKPGVGADWWGTPEVEVRLIGVGIGPGLGGG
jgi:hypothetical protein